MDKRTIKPDYAKLKERLSPTQNKFLERYGERPIVSNSHNFYAVKGSSGIITDWEPRKFYAKPYNLEISDVEWNMKDTAEQIAAGGTPREYIVISMGEFQIPLGSLLRGSQLSFEECKTMEPDLTEEDYKAAYRTKLSSLKKWLYYDFERLLRNRMYEVIAYGKITTTTLSGKSFTSTAILIKEVK